MCAHLTPGVWATGKTVEETREELRTVLEDWMLIGLRKGETLPEIDGINLNGERVGMLVAGFLSFQNDQHPSGKREQPKDDVFPRK